MTLMGVFCGIGAIVFVLQSGGMLRILLNWEAIVLIFGGTAGSIMISYPWSALRWVASAAWKVIFPPKRAKPAELIASIVALAEKARRQGIDRIQDDIPSLPHPFLADGVKMLLDGLDEDVLRDRLERDIAMTRLRHQQLAGVFQSAGTFAPIFGLLGTLVGVVQVLRNIQDPQMMGSSMAIAMTASFYGIFSANFIFLPVAGKLNYYSEEEMLNREIIAKGTMAIHAGDIPWLVSKKLDAYIATHLRIRTGTAK
ncbi:MAG: MotA/TolQ/ExbB proton channel family protein [bacterium]